MASAENVAKAARTIVRTIGELGHRRTAIFLQKSILRVIAINSQYPDLTDAAFQRSSSDWFVCAVVYRMAEELDITNLDLVERQPFQANYETHVNWPAITAIAKASFDCITPIAIYCAVLTPERVRSITYRDVVSSEANVSPWEMSLAELQGFPTFLGNVANLLNVLETATGVQIIANHADYSHGWPSEQEQENQSECLHSENALVAAAIARIELASASVPYVDRFENASVSAQADDEEAELRSPPTGHDNPSEAIVGLRSNVMSIDRFINERFDQMTIDHFWNSCSCKCCALIKARAALEDMKAQVEVLERHV
ncbi:hypothetical protein F4860DRAFT_510840 [Xylaria cubensis]|nr:hypothetical protein F4860DRAFT_510840 [Xylaria cubensis]